MTVGKATGTFTTDYTSRTVKLRVHSKTLVSAEANGTALPVTKLTQDASALPFANTGASVIADVYEITVDASLASETTVTLAQAPRGDVNGDGTLSVADALTALRCLVDEQYSITADVNEDGVLSLIDILVILQTIIK